LKRSFKFLFSVLAICIAIIFFRSSEPKFESLSEENSVNLKLLAIQIISDKELDVVLDLSKIILKNGVMAGGHYNEVWIRDLNTFINVALEVGDPKVIRESLVKFFYFQDQNGAIVDGYVSRDKAIENYKYIKSPKFINLLGFKNTVETDQESSLIQAIYKYIQKTSDYSILEEKVNGVKVIDRLELSLLFLMNHRYSHDHGLIWGATTADWGDVQPEHEWGTELDESSNLAIDVYDNSMFVIAIDNYLSLSSRFNKKSDYWLNVKVLLKNNVKNKLWVKPKFIPHIYLNKSPFPSDFDENSIYYHGGTAVAIEAGILSHEEILEAYKTVVANIKKSGAKSIGLNLYPPYPKGFFKNKMMEPYSYQNGGDWPWFGARWVLLLEKNNLPRSSYKELKKITSLILKSKGFYEWYDRNGVGMGAKDFKGTAGVTAEAIINLRSWANLYLSKNRELP
jgi:hypothetical protein